VWCGKCYTSNKEVDFVVNGLVPEGGNEVDENRLEAVWNTRRQAKNEFHSARNGDHLMVPFECDYCIFAKLRGSGEGAVNTDKDALLLACIRRANLDAFWSRATSTVVANGDRVRASLALSDAVGLHGPYENHGTLPHFDHCGYEVAIQMLLASRKPGRYSQKYSQWDTIRKIRTVYSNQYKASVSFNSATLALADERGQSQRLVDDKCASFWFSRFFAGCRRRMGQDWRPNKAMSTQLIVQMLKKVSRRIESLLDPEEQLRWLVFGTYSVLAYVLSLRGSECLLVDMKGMIEYENKGNNQFFIVALLGKIKGEHQDRCHLLPCATKTSSGINVKEWVHALLQEKKSHGQVDGPMFSLLNNVIITTHALDDMLTEILEEIYDMNPESFPLSITDKDDISRNYQVFRTFRRSSDTRALEQQVSGNDIDIVNRWHRVEEAKGGRPTFQMKEHYAQVELLLKPFIRYTSAM
jgi:hypothetical protein